MNWQDEMVRRYAARWSAGGTPTTPRDPAAEEAARLEFRARAAAARAAAIERGICPLCGSEYWPEQIAGDHCPDPDCDEPVARSG